MKQKPLTSSEQEKIHLEHDAAKVFMRLYEAISGIPIRHIWHNEPNKPDVSCRLNGERLDLEIAHMYGSEQEAMKLLGRDLSRDTQSALQQLAHYATLEQRLMFALQRILNNKAEKDYQSKRVWLVIRNAHPAWKVANFLDQLKQVCVPSHHPFEQIWLVGDVKGETGIYQLYP